MSFYMYTFIGTDVYSSFRIDQLNQILKKANIASQIIGAKHYYVLETNNHLTAEQITQVQKLLVAESDEQELSDCSKLILPRPGTISPWSTKATDIFHHCVKL